MPDDNGGVVGDVLGHVWLQWLTARPCESPRVCPLGAAARVVLCVCARAPDTVRVRVQFKKLLQEATMESTENTRPLFAKYTV
jgi:hypothetical protein